MNSHFLSFPFYPISRLLSLKNLSFLVYPVNPSWLSDSATKSPRLGAAGQRGVSPSLVCAPFSLSAALSSPCACVRVQVAHIFLRIRARARPPPFNEMRVFDAVVLGGQSLSLESSLTFYNRTNTFVNTLVVIVCFMCSPSSQ